MKKHRRAGGYTTTVNSSTGHVSPRDNINMSYVTTPANMSNVLFDKDSHQNNKGSPNIP